MLDFSNLPPDCILLPLFPTTRVLLFRTPTFLLPLPEPSQPNLKPNQLCVPAARGRPDTIIHEPGDIIKKTPFARLQQKDFKWLQLFDSLRLQR